MQKQLLNIIKGTSIWELSIEQLRHKLSSKSNSIQDVFTRINQNHDNKITPIEIQDFLATYRVPISQKQSKFIISLASNSGYLSIRKQDILISFESIFTPAHKHKNYNKPFQNQKKPLSIDNQIIFYRKLLALKEAFVVKHGTNLTSTFKEWSQGKQNLQYENLLNVFVNKKIKYSKTQFNALLHRGKQSKINYQVFYNLIIPEANYFKKQKNLYSLINSMKKELKNLKISSDEQNEVQENRRYDEDNVSIRRYHKIDAPNFYKYDEGYMKQMEDYRQRYVQPSKDFKFKYEETFRGLQYHDHYFNNFYVHLNQRDKLQKFYNKFGKKFAYQSTTDLPVEYPKYIRHINN